MKKIIKSLSIYAVILLSMVGCSDDFLEIPLKGTLPFTSESLDSDEKVYAILMSSYDFLQVKYYNGWSSWYMLANLPSDDAVPVGGGFSDRPEYWDLHEFETTPENSATIQFWRRNYYGIYRANLVINDVTFESPAVTSYKAEAKFLRAYYYFQLVKAYGNVAFYTVNLAPSEYQPSNTDKSVIYAQMIQDLQEAIPDLPLKSKQSPADLTRISKGAAQSLLGKIYLYTKDYANAASVLDQVINSNEYDLIAEYDSLFRRSENFGRESVFEVPYMQYVHGDFWANGRESEGNIDAQLNGPRETAVGEYNGGWGFDMIDSSLVDAWDAAGDVVRKYGTGFGPEYFKANLVLTPEQDANDNGFPDEKEKEGWTGWYQKKRTTIKGYFDATQSPSETTYENNEHLIRFADVLLMAAEAHNQNSNDTRAQEYVNRVRARASLDPISSTGNALFEAIKLERRLELAMEGHRFYDLVRWGDAPRVLGPLGFVEGKNEVFPIPAAEIGLTNLVQNPGY